VNGGGDGIICPDADRFPLSDGDRHLAAEAGFHLFEVAGRSISDLSTLSQHAVGCLAWGGWYSDEVFVALPRLRVLARCGAGTDNIDMAAASRRGIRVTYVPGASDEEVSDHTIALLVACARKLRVSDQRVRMLEWPSSRDLHPMRRLSGSRLGLVGLGRIASAVSRKATAFGIEVSSFDPFVDTERFVHLGVHRSPSLTALLEGSDYVSLHVPAAAGRAPLIGAAEIAAMKQGAVLINTSRGSLVDSFEVAKALANGHLAGAGLDVLETEPITAGHPILACDSAILTPHSAAFSTEALADIRRQAISDAIAVLNDAEPRFPVEPSDGVELRETV
jgi:D-3-phosphoglycerate dehydrogenase